MVLHAGRTLEIRDQRVMTALQVWIYGDDRPVGLHSTLSLRNAAAGLVAGRFSLDISPALVAAE